MAKKLLPRRGSESAHSTFIGDIGEITVDLTNHSVVVHDGETQGGWDLKKELVSGDFAVSGLKLSELVSKYRETKSFLEFLPPVKRKDYLEGTGIYDFTAELTSAATFSASAGLVVLFPPGEAKHNGFEIFSGSCFLGAGIDKSKLTSTTLTNSSISINYIPDSNDWKKYWIISGFTITAVTKGSSESQTGIKMDSVRHGVVSRVKITNHYVNQYQRASWSCYFEFVDLEYGHINQLIDIGPETPGVPNTYVGLNIRHGGYNQDIRERGLGATIFSGGCNESATIAGARIVGQENRTITYSGMNFEANAIDLIMGDDSTSTSGPTNVSFKGVQFNSRTTNKPFSMDLRRGQNLLLDGCHFIGYDKIALLSSNFGDFHLIGNGGSTVFAESSQANTPIPLNGVVSGRRSRWSTLSNTGVIFYQEADLYPILASRRLTERFNRFSISADGTLNWSTFDTELPDTIFGRISAGVVGPKNSTVLRLSAFAVAARPTATAVGVGGVIWDTDTGRPLWSNGASYINALGITYTNQSRNALTVSAGTTVATTVAATGVPMGYSVEVSYSEPLNGVDIRGEVTSVGTITVYFRNSTGSSVTVPAGTLYVAFKRMS